MNISMKNNAILSVFNCLVKFLLFTEIIAKIILIQLNYWEYISSKRNPVSPFFFFFFFFPPLFSATKQLILLICIFSM